jgi:hypothetical protein
MTWIKEAIQFYKHLKTSTSWEYYLKFIVKFNYISLTIRFLPQRKLKAAPLQISIG